MRARIAMLQASVWLRAGYWCYYGAIGCFVPFIALYYQALGLAGLQIGVLAAVLPLGTAFLAPAWGALADSFSAHRLVLRASLVLAACSALWLASITRFELILLAMALLALFAAAIPPLLDSYAITISEREGLPYGRLRVWGTVGFIAAVTAVGWWMGAAVSNFFLIAYATALLLAFVSTLGLPPLQPRTSRAARGGVAAILSNRSVVLLLLTAYLVLTNASLLGNFFGIYLVAIGGNARLVGSASAMGALSELPVLIFGNWLIARIGSRRLLMVAIVAYVIRFGLYSIPPAPAWILPIQLLHGLSFAAYLMASVTLAHELAGRERAATAQGLLASTSIGFGAITGSLVGGALLDQLGVVNLFRIAALGMIVALAVYTVGSRLVARAEAADDGELRLHETPRA